jgi:prepilin-type N-terminal cleavage/methylation domain-containing protein
MKRDSRSGFTLFEVIIAIALSSIIVLGIGKFSNSISSVGVLINNELQADHDIQLAFRDIVSEIRSMEPSGAGAYPLETATTSSIVFYSDIDQDGIPERVRYTMATSSFQKGVIRPTGNPLTYPTSTEVVTTVAPSIIRSSSTFDYFDSSYTGTQTPLASPVSILAVRVVRVNLVAEVSTSTAPRPLILSNTITIRNLRSN